MIIINALIPLRKVKNAYLIKLKVCKDHELKQSEPNSSPQIRILKQFNIYNWQNGRPVRSKPNSFISWHCTIVIRNAKEEGHSDIKAAKPKNPEEKETPNAATSLSSYKVSLVNKKRKPSIRYSFLFPFDFQTSDAETL